MKSFSSGEVANICDVTSRTVIRWIAAGRLEAFKLPGRGNNRVSEIALIAFLQENQMPIPNELRPELDRHCVMMADDPHLTRHVKRIIRDVDYITYCYDNGLEAGFEIANKQPSLIVIDDDLADISAAKIVRQINSLVDYAPLIIVFSNEPNQVDVPLDQYDIQILAKPLDLHHFSNMFDQANGENDLLSA